MFGDEGRLLKLAAELTELGSNEAIQRYMQRALDRDDKLRLAVRMIETWSEVMQRLLAEPEDARPGRMGRVALVGELKAEDIEARMRRNLRLPEGK